MSAPFDAAFLDAALHTIPGGVFVYDCEHRTTVFASRAFQELLGYNTGKVASDSGVLKQVIIHTDDRPSVRAAITRARSLPKHEQTQVSFRVRRADGEWRWLHTRGAPILPTGTSPTRYLVGVSEDVTERRQAEEALAQSAESMQLAQQLANVGSYDRSLVTGHVFWSQQMYRIHGADPIRDDPNQMGDLIERFVHPDDRTIVRSAMRDLAATGAAGPFAYRVVHADGTVRNVVGQSAILKDDAGTPIRRVGSVIDATARVQAEEERVALQSKIRDVQKLESLGVLAGGIAHDFNNLLVGILGNASVSLLDMPVSSPSHAAVTAIERAARDAASLTRQLLAYAGKGRYLLEPLDLSMLIRQLRPVLQTALGPRASLAIELAENVPVIHGDAEQVRQALVNLVTNATEAIGERAGKVTISSADVVFDSRRLARCIPGSHAQPGRFVCLTVEDDGHGMDVATLARIFDPFFSTKLAGRGLGLAATLGIVHGHAGALEVTSTRGRGTTFKLYFPAAYEERMRSLTPTGQQTGVPNASRARVRVLVVDDDEHVRTLAHRVLERLSYDSVEVADGVEALDFLRQDASQVDAVLLDMTMPRMNGEDTLRGVRALAPWLPVILMSGHDERDVTPRLLEHGLGGYLQKPFTVDALASIFARVVGPPDRS